MASSGGWSTGGYGRGPVGLRAVTGVLSDYSEKLASAALTFGTVVYGLSRAAALAQKSLDGMADRIDKILVKQGPDITVSTKPQDVADYIQNPPGRTSWLGRGLREAGKNLTPTGLLDSAQDLIASRFGPKPESLTDKAIDQLTPAELTEALTVPTLTKPQRDYVRKRLGQIGGHADLETRGQQAYDTSPYAPTAGNRYYQPAIVVFNAGIIGSTQDAMTTIQRAQRNNHQSTVVTAPRTG